MKKLKIGSQHGHSEAKIIVKDHPESQLEMSVGDLHDNAKRNLNIDNVGAPTVEPVNPYLARIGLFCYLLMVAVALWTLLTNRIGIVLFSSIVALGAAVAIVVSGVELRMQGKLSEKNLMTLFQRSLKNLFSGEKR